MVGVADLVKTPAGGLEFRIGVVPVDSTRSGGDAALPRRARHATRGGATRVLTRPLAEIKRPLVRAGAQYPLGALIAEARRNVLRTDLGLVRTESIRADLPAGPGDLRAALRGRAVPERPRPPHAHRRPAHGRARAVRSRADGTDASTWPARRCATIRARRGGQAGARGGAPGRPEGPRRRRVHPRDRRGERRQGAGGLTPLAGVLYEREGLLDVEAVARVPPPSAPAGRGAPAAAFVSTRS